MTRPGITEDQREIAIELLANALRKDAHLRSRAQQTGDQADMVRSRLARGRAESSQRYIDGMRDMLRVLFPNGSAIAEQCLDEAYLRAMGLPPRNLAGDDRKH